MAYPVSTYLALTRDVFYLARLYGQDERKPVSNWLVRGSASIAGEVHLGLRLRRSIWRSTASSVGPRARCAMSTFCEPSGSSGHRRPSAGCRRISYRPSPSRARSPTTRCLSSDTTSAAHQCRGGLWWPWLIPFTRTVSRAVPVTTWAKGGHLLITWLTSHRRSFALNKVIKCLGTLVFP